MPRRRSRSPRSPATRALIDRYCNYAFMEGKREGEAREYEYAYYKGYHDGIQAIMDTVSGAGKGQGKGPGGKVGVPQRPKGIGMAPQPTAVTPKRAGRRPWVSRPPEAEGAPRAAGHAEPSRVAGRWPGFGGDLPAGSVAAGNDVAAHRDRPAELSDARSS